MTIRHIWRALPLALLSLAFVLPAQAQQRLAGAPGSAYKAAESAEALRTLDAAGIRLTPIQKAALSDHLARERAAAPARPQPATGKRLAALSEDFQSGAFPPTGWAVFQDGSDGSGLWQEQTGVSPNLYARSRYNSGGTSAGSDYFATPLLSVSAGDNTLEFKMWQTFGTNYGSVYAVMVSTGSQTTVGDYVDVAVWDEATPCPGDTNPPAVGTAPATRNCSVDLSAYDGQNVYVAFRHTNDFGDNFELDDVLGPEVFVAAGATFSVNPQNQDFGTVAQCGANSQTFTILNSGNGTLDVGTLVLTADAPFTLLNDDASGASLGLGETATFDVQFSPTTDGVFTGAVSIPYTLDGGAPQAASVQVDGIGSMDNVNRQVQNGYLVANSTVCAGGDRADILDVPFGTAAGDTELVLGDDQVSASLPLTGTRIRLYGQPHNNMYVSSNGIVSFGAAPGGSFSTSGNGTTFLATTAIDLAPNTGGQIFYGFRDVTGHPGLEVIVTYYRVPFFSGGGYLTAQAIISPSSTRGGNSSVIVQYLNGTDPADGMPFSVVSAAQETNILTQLVGDQTNMFALYSTSSSTAPKFGGETTLTTEFTPRGERIVEGDAGWRLLSHGPSSAPQTGYLVEQNLVQGIPGQYPSNDVNLFVGFDGTAYSSPATDDEALTSGKGLFWYFFDRTQNPVTTTGTSNTIALPAALVAGGPEVTADVVVALTAGLDSDGIHSEMLGNPFTSPFDASTLTFNAGDASNVALLYDPVTNDFSPAPGNEVPVWGGFFVDAGSATEATFPGPAPLTDTGAPAAADARAETRRIAFELSGTRADGSRVADRGAVLTFSEAATADWDAQDALKPGLPGARVELGIEGGLRNGVARPRAQASYPLDAAVTAELSVAAVGTAEELTLRWDAIDNVPEGWTLQLRDIVTGAVVDLRTEEAYTFAVEATELTVADKAADAGLTPPVPTAKAASPVRFVVEVTPDGTLPTTASKVSEFALEGARPNPMRGTATARFALPEAGQVDVTLYDLLGRRVAVLAQGELGAGWHDVSIDAASLSAGVYVLRMQADGFAETQRVTVVR